MAGQITYYTPNQASPQLRFRFITNTICIFLATILTGFGSMAQVSQYVFSSTTGTYQAGATANTTPASVLPTGWDDQTTTYSLPFNFYYNGTTYTTAGSIGIHADGWVALSTGSISMVGTGAGGSWVSKSNPAGAYLYGSANNNGFAVCNADWQEQVFSNITGTINTGNAVITSVSSFLDIEVGTRLSGTGISDGTVVLSFDAMAGTITMSSPATAAGAITITPRSSVYAFTRGVAPNREFVVQWTQVRRYNAGSPESINVQLILHEGGGSAANHKIDVVFGDCSTLISANLLTQVGLRGNTSSDFNARTTATDWSSSSAASVNTDALVFSQALLPPDGLTYSWVPCVSVPASAGTLFGASSVCAGSSNTYTLAPVNGAVSYAWSFSGTGASFNSLTSTPSNTLSFSTGATAGTLTVTPQNACGNGASTAMGITINSLPLATITYGSGILCTSTGGQVSVSITGTGGGSFSSSPAGLSLNSTTGAITASASTPGSYIVTYSFSNGTCSNTATAPVTISSPLSGTYTVGSGGNFTTLTAAVNAYNNNCLNGSVTFLLTNANYTALTGEVFPIEIKKNGFANVSNTLTIKPAPGVTAQISGVANDNALIRVLGDFISIDGSDDGSLSRKLSIINTGTTLRPRSILFGSSGTVPVTNCSVRNCILQAGTTDASVVLCSDISTLGNPGYFNNISILNNSLRNSLYGIFAIAVNAGTNGSGTVIGQNDINNAGALAIQYVGIYAEGINGLDIADNRIGNFRGTDDATDNGIWIGTNVRNLQIRGNIISNINYTGSASQGVRGIYISSGVSNANILIANNMISNLSSDGSDYTNALNGLNNPVGILVSANTTQSGIRIYNNSINLGGVTGYTNTLTKANAVSTCIRLRSDSYVDMQNNILVNRLNRAVSSSSLGAACILSSLNNTALFTGLDNNIYFAGGVTNGGIAACGFISATGTAYTTIAAWRTYTGKDAASLNVLPVFVSGTDLHLDAAANGAISNKGKVLAAVSLDIDNQTRNPQTPDIGCDEFVLANTASWVGKVSTDWTLPDNWEANTVPNSTTDVTIDGGYSFLPTISTTQAVRNLTLLSPGTPPVLTVTGTLQVYGDMSYTGLAKISASNGTLEMAGTSAQTIPAGIFQNNRLLNLVVSNSSLAGLTLGGTLDIYRSVTFTPSGNKLNTGDFLTFKSNASGTAWLGDVTGKTINGQATVERYIPTGISHPKTWQLLAVPVSGSQTVNQAWQEGNTPMSNLLNPGFGTIITGNVPNATSLGFDAATAASSGPGMKVYNAATNAWDGIANTNTLPIANKKGYMIFIRGDRSVTTSSSPATTTVLRAKGQLYTASAGQLPPSSSVAANSFESVGNPYASAIDFTQISKPGPAFIDNTFYVWDPTLAGSQNLGGYQTISSTNGFKPVPGGTINYPSDSVITTIQSGQAFFIHATGAGSGGTISFTEAAKKQGSSMVFRGNGEQSSLRAVLFAGSRLADANLVVFHETYTNAYTGEDALKLNNSGENFGIGLEGKVMSLEAREPVRNQDTIVYKLTNLRRQDYNMVFVPSDMNREGFTAWLTDRYLGTEMPVSLTDSTTLTFTVNNDPASSADDRFILVFRQNIVLPVTITSISATRNRDVSVGVRWSVEQEVRIEEYVVERSADGQRFDQVGSVRASGQSSMNYEWIDRQALKQASFYRVKAIGTDGDIRYTKVARVASLTGSESVRVFPNPVADQTIHLYLDETDTNSYTVRLYNQSGQLVYSSTITPAGNQPVLVKVGKIPAGIYQLVLTANQGIKQEKSLQVVIL